MAPGKNEPDSLKRGGIRIQDAEPADAREILELQKLAFQSEAEFYNDYTLPPLTQTLEGMREDYTSQIVLKAVLDGRIVGSARGYVKDGTGYINRVIVHPESQNRGMGALIMKAMEERLAGARRFELFTGSQRTRSLHFYGKLGYTIYKTVPGRIELAYMEKKAGG
jgi:ribosomal protein S18 acetylase RimI-like enzyme